MQTHKTCSQTGCPLKMMNRRRFLASTGALALAASGCSQLSLSEKSSSLADRQGLQMPPIAPARIRAAFVHPGVERYWMGWPGAAYDIRARQRQYTDVLKAAAQKQQIKLELIDEPLKDDDIVNAFIQNLTKEAPDGILIVTMCLHHPDFGAWRKMNRIAENKGQVPMIVFSPMGTSFTSEVHGNRYPDLRKPGVFVGATQDVEWLATGLKMLNTVHRMKHSRLLVLKGDNTEDRKLDIIGTTLHYIPRNRWPEEFHKTQTNSRMLALAEFYTKQAEKIVEPNKQDIINSAKNYFVARKLMAAEGCHGISVDCLPLVRDLKIPCPPCMAWLQLNDEGSVGCCEADTNAAISLRLTALLCDRPGFMQDPAPNTVRNTLNGAHCSCPTRLDGFDMPPSPLILRNHSESELGVSPQVLWRTDQKVTVMKFEGPEKMIVGTGRVLRNIDTPPSGGCRTSLELEMDNLPDARDTRGFHQLFIYGDLENEFKAYCQLSGIKVEPLYGPRDESRKVAAAAASRHSHCCSC
ncbi:MAG TPA: hypothetical protein VMX13_07745 [Sedimentisphaerales bacterium]|nr:hypothetical protein [Sedimentisphaerales bacterium]